MNTGRRLLQEVRNAGLLFGLTVILGVITGGLIILQARTLSHLINQVFLRQQTREVVLPFFGLLLIILFTRVFFTFVNGATAAALSASIKKRLRKALLEKIDRLGPAFTSAESTGELTTSALQGVEALDAYFSQYLPQILISALLPVLILLVVFPLDALTGIVFLVTAPLIPFFMALIGRASQSETRRQWQALSRLGAYFLDTLQGITTLKTLGQSGKRAEQIEDVSEKYRETTLKVLRITFLSALTLEMLATISTAVVAVEIGLRLLYGKIAFEQAFFILLLAPEFYQPLRALGARYHAGMSGVAAAQRIYEVLDAPEPEMPLLKGTQASGLVSHKPFRLELEGICFAYPDRQRDALMDVSFAIPTGSSIGLVGRSGAGKSTLLQLLLRFIAPGSGRILLDGVDLSSISLQAWRRQVTWVPQRPALFNTSILENIRIANKTASMDEIRAAAAKAQLDDFVMSLPDRYDTLVYEKAVRLSSGQAQRIALARAFLKDAPLLLMDEPTAHLDVELEDQLTQAVQKLMLDRTTLVIAHRLSTIRNLESIILLEQGRVSSIGSYSQLLSSSLLFKQLVMLSGGTT